ncbi:MAG: translocation/assembly module TamB domain-containing protein [Muribaculaceae bacterium]|nr:translocation/assembly module TamB domain-containing protein [Muribaculaceae bacterium]
MFGKKGNMFSKAARWLGGGLLGLVAALPFAMYIPWVQNKVADAAAEYASEKTGMDISVGDVRVRFPLDVTATDVQVLDQNGDTLFKADEVKGDVKPGPLLDKKVEVENASLKGAKSQVKTDDGSMDLDVDLDDAIIDAASVDLNNNKVDVGNASLKGGKAKMSYKPEKKKPDPDKEPSKPWKVNARKVSADDVDFKMDMKPTVDKLDAKVGHAEAKNVKVDTGEKTVDVGELNVDKADVDYKHPSEKDAKQYRKDHPMPKDADQSSGDDKPWTVNADKVRVSNSKAKYGQTGKNPNKPGTTLDPDNIEVEDLNADIDNLHYDGDNLNVPVKHLSGKERSGLQVKDASGTVNKNKNGLDLNDIKLKTKGSDIKLDAHVDQDMLDGKPNGKATIDTDSKIDLNEVEKLVPEARMSLKDLPHNKPVSIKAKARGNDKRLDVHSLDADIPGVGRIKGKGTIYNPTDMDRMKADLDTEVDLRDPSVLNKMLGLKDVKLPPMKMSGKLSKEGCRWVARNLRVSTGGGTMRGDGYYDVCNENYDVDADFNNFPVKSFLPNYDVNNLTGSIDARGHGFDFTDCGSTWTDATVNLANVRYNGKQYGNLKARGKLRGGYADVYASGRHTGYDFDANAHGTICNDHYVFTADGDIRDLDLKKLGMYDGVCNGKTRLHAEGDINLRTKEWDADLQLTDVDWQLDSSLLVADNARAMLHSTPWQTCITVENEDNYAHLNSPCGMTELMEDLQNTATEVQRQLKERWIDIERLKEPMPWFDFDMHMGTDGLVQRYLQQHEIDFRDVSCEMSRDSVLFLDGRAHGISYGETNIDTITVHANELQNTYLAFNAHMGNRPGTWDEYAQVDIEGGIKGPALDFMLHQQNIKGETGYRLGCNARLTDDEVRMRLFGKDPVIGYRHWTFNEDNHVNVDYRTRMLDANLQLRSDSSSVELLTQRILGENRENVLLNVNNLKLEEWTRIVPMLDRTSGTVNANVDINWDGANADGDGIIAIKDFVYNGKPEGDVILNADFDLDPATQSTRLTADVVLDGKEAIVLEGTLNDMTTGSPLNMEARFNRFPLERANAFIPGDYIWLDGYAVGTLGISGQMDDLRMNGYFTADGARVNLPRYGSSLSLSTDRVPIEDNVITFDKYKLIGANRSPVVINGTVDLRAPDNMIIDLTANGREVQFMNSKQDEVTQVFGKGLADINATVRSRGGVMTVRADAKLLPGSDITYVMKDDISQLSTAIDEDMVTFIDFNQPETGPTVLVTGKGSNALNILANIEVEQGAKINAYLSEDGQNRATIDGSGRLKYTVDFAGRDNLTGTYTIASGNMRYTPPLITQRIFDIKNGSTIIWNGEMLNPQLNLKGTARVKSSFTDDAQKAHPADFFIDAKVGGSLNNIDLSFDLSCEGEDVAYAQNEIQTMNESERLQNAISLLLYNTYLGAGGEFRLNVNTAATSALFSFLQSRLNAWAAETLPGIDISFGINQYQGAVDGGTKTSYSYRLAKTLFNDRFKIVVGGEYSPDAIESEQIAEKLFNDISLEYYLNDNATRYLKLFHHSSYENVLEGPVTETGVAYVLKRKLTNLKNLFTFKHSREYLLRDSLEKARKAELKLMENAIDAMSDEQQSDSMFTVPLDDGSSDPDIDKPTVIRKREDESED